MGYGPPPPTCRAYIAPGAVKRLLTAIVSWEGYTLGAKQILVKMAISSYLEHYVKQQLFQSLSLHTGPSLNCPGETAELWQSELSWPLVRT